MRLSLQPSLDPDAYRYVHHLRTRFAETDAMGIIHHGTFPAYLEEARAAMLREAGFPYEVVRAGPGGIDFAVLELYVRHRRPLRFDDLVGV
ncbi:MAG TPA: hotdog domain-containing protein, partial [Acidimicrobiales bacterium]